MKRKRLLNKRPKAFLGLDGAIQATATIQSAIMNAAAQAKAAKLQSDSIDAAAKTNARALSQQSINNERVENQKMELTMQNNNKLVDSIGTLKLNESLTQGRLNNQELARENRITLKRGGSAKRKRRLANQTLATGNLPFKILDGGGARYLGETPYGNLMYELYGNDHEHYHKAQGGKYKSGVGIRTADGVVFEGEGNQNTNQGEYIMVNPYDPSDVKAISKHQIGNINPVKAINAGMVPEQAYMYQELNKGDFNPLLDYGYAKFGGSTRRRLRRGGRCKAANGWPPIISFDYNGNHYIIDHGQLMSNEGGGYDDQYGFAGFNGVVPKGRFATYLTQNHNDVPNFKPISTDDVDAAYDIYNKAWADYFARPEQYTAARGLTDGYMETGIDNPIANNQNTTTKPWHERLKDPNDAIYSNPLITNWAETFKNNTGLDYEPGVTSLPYDVVTKLFPNENILDTSPEWKKYQGIPEGGLDLQGDSQLGTVTTVADSLRKKDKLTGSNNNFWKTPTAGALINASAQLTGAGINAIGNFMSARKLSDAYGRAARTMTNAYNSLRTVDESKWLNDDDWKVATYTPALRFSGYNVNPQLADIDRTSMNQARAISNNTASGAARLNRLANMNINAQEQRSKVYADQGNREEQIKQKNLEALNKAAYDNANALTQHRTTLTNARLDLAKYNNDIANERIMGAANAQSQMGINAASAKANALTSSVQGITSALNNSAQGFSNAFNTEYKYNNDLINTIKSGTVEDKAKFYINKYIGSAFPDLRWGLEILDSLPPDSPYASDIRSILGIR